MQAISEAVAQVLRTSIRAPRAYAFVQVPLITNQVSTLNQVNSQAASGSKTASTSWTVSYPTVPANGDGLLLFITSTVAPSATPSGWSVLLAPTAVGSEFLTIYCINAAASTPASTTITFASASKGVWALQEWTGVATSNVFQIGLGTTATGTSNVASLTFNVTQQYGCMLEVYSCVGQSGAVTITDKPPKGQLTEQDVLVQDGSNETAMAIFQTETDPYAAAQPYNASATWTGSGITNTIGTVIWIAPTLTNGTIDYNKCGSQLILQKILSLQSTTLLEPGSNTCNISFSGQEAAFSPILPTNTWSRYFYPGAVDNRVAVYMGIRNTTDTSGDSLGQAETIYAMGQYIIQSYNQESESGQNKATLNMFDNWSMFNQTIYAQFPPRLFGNQASNYFNPNYAMKNPSGDGKTWTCDAVNWMESQTQAPGWASDFQILTVYVGTKNSPASQATSLTFKVNYPLGQITFNSPVPNYNSTTNPAVVSVDARPLSMAPEQMMYHLFVDYGCFNPNFLKFDTSGIMLPVFSLQYDDTLVDIATQIMYATAPRGVQWWLWVDELGYINFGELPLDGPPVVTLTDQFDLLKISPEYSVQNLVNVVQAQSTMVNSQAVTVVSYNAQSINIFTQQATYTVPYEMTSNVIGMDPGSAAAYLTTLTSSLLFSMSTPTISMDAEVLYNPAYEVGDVVCVREQATGINKNFYIGQITNSLNGPDIRQTLRLTQCKYTQDFMGGLSAYAGAPLPSSQNPGIGATALIENVSIAGTQVVLNGDPVLDATLQPVLPVWDGSPLSVSIEMAQPPMFGKLQSSFYIWRWMYIAEDAYWVNPVGNLPVLLTGNGNNTIFPSNSATPTANVIQDLSGGTAYAGTSGGVGGSLWTPTTPLYGASTQFYDFRANLDTPASRRYFWPLLRCQDWLNNDGQTAYTGQTTLNSTWNYGPGINGANFSYESETGWVFLNGNLRVGLSNYFNTTTNQVLAQNTTVGYFGQPIYAAGTPAATQLGFSSTAEYGVDFGVPMNVEIVYGIKRKYTFCYLGILVASTAGAVQVKRIPFLLRAGP